MGPIKKLVLVTTALCLEDGGIASLARVVAASTRDYSRLHNLDFEILDLGRPSDIMQDYPIQYFMGNQLQFAFSIWQRILSEQHTAFIFMHVGPARTMSFIPKFVQPRFLIWFHGLEVWRQLNWQQQQAIKTATKRLANSAYTERRTRAIYPWLPPTDVVHLTLENREVSGEIDEDLLQQIGDSAILIVGRLDSSQRHKGHDDLIKVMPELIALVPQAKLIIAGKGDDLTRLEALADSLRIQDHVIFTGFVTEKTLEALYQRCRVFAMLSRNDGFGLVYLEAMKAGKACIGLHQSSGAEIIKDNETGFLIEPNNQKQLLAALVQLLTDPILCQQLGEAGYEQWRRNYTYEAFERRFHAHLDELTG